MLSIFFICLCLIWRNVQVFCPFFWLGFLILRCMSCLYILEINFFVSCFVCSYFLPFWGLDYFLDGSHCQALNYIISPIFHRRSWSLGEGFAQAFCLLYSTLTVAPSLRRKYKSDCACSKNIYWPSVWDPCGESPHTLKMALLFFPRLVRMPRPRPELEKS